MRARQKSLNEPNSDEYFSNIAFHATLKHNKNSARALFPKPQVAAGLLLAVHCQLQEIGPFYQDGANLG